MKRCKHKWVVDDDIRLQGNIRDCSICGRQQRLSSSGIWYYPKVWQGHYL